MEGRLAKGCEWSNRDGGGCWVYSEIEGSLINSVWGCRRLTVCVGVSSPGQSPDLVWLRFEARQRCHLVAEAVRTLCTVVCCAGAVWAAVLRAFTCHDQQRESSRRLKINYQAHIKWIATVKCGYFYVLLPTWFTVLENSVPEGLETTFLQNSEQCFRRFMSNRPRGNVY